MTDFDSSAVRSAAERWTRRFDREALVGIFRGDLDPGELHPQMIDRIVRSTTAQERCALFAEALGMRSLPDLEKTLEASEAERRLVAAEDEQVIPRLKRSDSGATSWWRPLELISQLLERPVPALLSSLDPSPEGLGWGDVAERTVGVRRRGGWSSGTLFAVSPSRTALVVFEGNSPDKTVLVRTRSGREDTASRVRTVTVDLGTRAIELTVLSLPSAGASAATAWTLGHAPAPGEEVWVSALGDRLRAGEFAAAEDPAVFRSTCEVEAGFGGGPTCDANRNLIGLTVGGGTGGAAHLGVQALIEIVPELGR